MEGGDSGEGEERMWKGRWRRSKVTERKEIKRLLGGEEKEERIGMISRVRAGGEEGKSVERRRRV